MDNAVMHQKAPYPVELAGLVDRLEYRRGWTFGLAHLDRGQGSEGLTLLITISTADSYDQNRKISVVHYMLVPPAAYDIRSWQHWLFDQILLVERHEAMEYFTLRDTPTSKTFVKPYAPSHGFGQDPYLIRELGTLEDQRTSFRNELDS
jgi:hypothetical protein